MFVDIVIRESVVRDLARAFLSRFEESPAIPSAVPLRRYVCEWNPARPTPAGEQRHATANYNMLRFNVASDIATFEQTGMRSIPGDYSARGLNIRYRSSTVEATLRFEADFATTSDLAAADLGPLLYSSAGVAGGQGAVAGVDVPVTISSDITFTAEVNQPGQPRVPAASKLVMSIQGSTAPGRDVPQGPVEFGGAIRNSSVTPFPFRNFINIGFPIPIDLTELEQALGGVRVVASSIRFFAAERLFVVRLGFVPSTKFTFGDSSQAMLDVQQVTSEMAAFLDVPGAVYAGRISAGEGAIISVESEAMGHIAMELLSVRLPDGTNVQITSRATAASVVPAQSGIGFQLEFNMKISGVCPTLVPVDIHTHIGAQGSLSIHRDRPGIGVLRIHAVQNHQYIGSSILCSLTTLLPPPFGGFPGLAPVLGSFLGSAIGSGVSSSTRSTSIGGAVGGLVAIAGTLIAVVAAAQLTRISLAEIAARSGGGLQLDADGTLRVEVPIEGPWQRIDVGDDRETDATPPPLLRDPLSGAALSRRKRLATLEPLGLRTVNGVAIFGIRVKPEIVAGALSVSSVVPSGASMTPSTSTPIWRAAARSCSSGDPLSAALVVRIMNRANRFDVFPDNARFPMDICALALFPDPITSGSTDSPVAASIDLVSSRNQVMPNAPFRLAPGDYFDAVVWISAAEIRRLRILAGTSCPRFPPSCRENVAAAIRTLNSPLRLVIRSTGGRRLVKLPALSTFDVMELDEAAVLQRLRCSSGRTGVAWSGVRARIERPRNVNPLAFVESLAIEQVAVRELKLPQRLSSLPGVAGQPVPLRQLAGTATGTFPSVLRK